MDHDGDEGMSQQPLARQTGLRKSVFPKDDEAFVAVVARLAGQ